MNVMPTGRCEYTVTDPGRRPTRHLTVQMPCLQRNPKYSPRQNLKDTTATKRSKCHNLITTYKDPQTTRNIAIMPAPAEVQKKTIDAFLDGWAKWTPEAFLSTWSDDCTQQTLPYSHNVPKRDRANTNHLFPILMSIMDNLQVSQAFKYAIF